MIRELVRDGTTLLLTTQYLEEADRLADHVAVIDGGRVIAEGTTDELKSRVGGDCWPSGSQTGADGRGGRRHRRLGSGAPQVLAEAGRGHAAGRRGRRPAGRGGPAPGRGRLGISDLALRRPTLDDVFLALTGHVAEATPARTKSPGDRPGAAGADGEEQRMSTVASRTAATGARCGGPSPTRRR